MVSDFDAAIVHNAVFQMTTMYGNLLAQQRRHIDLLIQQNKSLVQQLQELQKRLDERQEPGRDAQP